MIPPLPFPQQLVASTALSALATGWESLYSTPAAMRNIGIDDKKALCGVVSRVLAVLPTEQWSTSLSILANSSVQVCQMLAAPLLYTTHYNWMQVSYFSTFDLVT